LGYTACSSGVTIANCDQPGATPTYSSTTPVIACGTCKSKYARAYSGGACTSVTFDNCNLLNSSGACALCNAGYIFDATKCVEKAGIIGGVFLLLGLLGILTA